MKRLLSFLFSLLTAVSCVIEIVDVPVGESADAEIAYVNLFFEVAGETKSSIPINESRINNLNVFVFRDGLLVDQIYVASSVSSATLMLPKDYNYSLYAIANVGEQKISPYEETFVHEFQCSIKRLTELSSGPPMVYCCKNLRVDSSSMNLTLHLERLIARIRLSIDANSLLYGLKIESVRLCQSASVVRPFRWYGQGGSRVLSPEETFDGDYASRMDLNTINAGREIILYTLENCQGVLLPFNSDPFLKVPQMLDGYEDLCTYLELSCSFNGAGLFGGTVDYRIYLGLDDCTSFDVPGNSSISIRLKLTGEGLDYVSWKVSADVSVMDGYARGTLLKGMHTVDDLYVGEKFLYEVTLDDDLLEFIAGDVAGCSLSVRKDGAETGCLHMTDLTVKGNVLQAELSCVAPGSGELCLYSPHGKCLGCLERNLQVKVPSIMASEHPQWPDHDSQVTMTDVPSCEINGTPASLYLYMVDDQGYNLNSENSYGFDSSLFDFQCRGIHIDGEPFDGLRHQCTLNTDNMTGHAHATVSLHCDNDGESHSYNLLLSDLFSSGESIFVDVHEKNFDISSETFVKLAIPQIELTLVDNGWAQYHDCQLSMIVDNPSNLPLETSVWQLVKSNRNMTAMDKDYVENNLILDRIQYMAGEFYDSQMPLYGACASFCSERNDYGDYAIEEGTTLVYPLSGIKTNDIVNAIAYDKLGFHRMAHVVDVTLNGQQISAEDILFHDNVSDGSPACDYLYYDEDSWNYAGVQLFSKGQAVNSLQNWLGEYPYVSAYSLDRMYDRYRSGQILDLSFDYDPDSEKVFMWDSTSGGPADLNLSSKFEGEVEGYVKTYPKGTWYSAQDNYCTVEINDVVSGIQLKSDGSKVWADEGILMSAMDEIYEFSYKDSPKPLGADAYQHRAHPTKMYLTVTLRTEADRKNDIFPISYNLNISDIDYYHQQDNANYKCSLSAECEAFNFVVVRHR